MVDMSGERARYKSEKNGSFSLIERVILSAGAMLIFSVSFQIDQMPEGEDMHRYKIYIRYRAVHRGIADENSLSWRNARQ